MSKFDWKAGLAKLAGAFVAGIVFAFLHVSPALADGVPQDWSLGLQTPGDGIEQKVYDFHTMLLYIITGVVLVVFVLLAYVIVRYNKHVNPHPSAMTHNVKLEIIWTLIPCLIVLAIAWVSFPLLYYVDRMPAPDMTLKVTGHQWYWSYEYPDNNDISFDSVAIWNSPDVTDADAAASIKDAEKNWLIKDKPMRLLEVDNRVVLPVGKVIRVDITGADVLHSWFVSSLGINRMAVVGRTNEVWFKIDKPGIYYGQCSMICGTGHGFMPIVIEGVTPEQFNNWVASKKTAANENKNLSVASK